MSESEQVTNTQPLNAQEYKDYLLEGLKPMMAIFDLIQASENSIQAAQVDSNYIEREQKVQQATIQAEDKIQNQSLIWPWKLNEQGFQALRAKYLKVMNLPKTTQIDRLFVYIKDGEVCLPNTPGAHFISVTGNSDDGYQVVDFTLLFPSGSGEIKAGDIPAYPSYDPEELGLSKEYIIHTPITDRDKDANETRMEFNKNQEKFRGILDNQMKESTQNTQTVIASENQDCVNLNNVIANAKALSHLAEALTRAIMRK